MKIFTKIGLFISVVGQLDFNTYAKVKESL